MAVTLGHRHPVRIKTPWEVVIGAALATAVAVGLFFAISSWTDDDTAASSTAGASEATQAVGTGHPLGTAEATQAVGTGHPLGTAVASSSLPSSGATVFQHVGAASVAQATSSNPAVEDIFRHTGGASLASVGTATINSLSDELAAIDGRAIISVVQQSPTVNSLSAELAAINSRSVAAVVQQPRPFESVADEVAAVNSRPVSSAQTTVEWGPGFTTLAEELAAVGSRG